MGLLHVGDDGAHRSAPRRADAEAGTKERGKHLRSRPSHRVQSFVRVLHCRHDLHGAQTEAFLQFERELEIDWQRPLDRDLDDVLLPRPLDHPRHGHSRCVEAVSDLLVGLPLDIVEMSCGHDLFFPIPRHRYSPISSSMDMKARLFAARSGPLRCSPPPMRMMKSPP